jgi:alcohol dehydrogenase class IV
LAENFTWLDGERLIRFGDGALDEAPELLAQRGFDGYVLLTTQRALEEPGPLVPAAAGLVQVPAGPVPEAAAAVHGEVRDRPLVALGGGRVIDSAKAIAGADGLACAAVPTTLSGAEMTRFHRMPEGIEDYGLVRPSLVIAEPRLMASQPMPAVAASAMNALGHAVEALYTPYANPVAKAAALRAAQLLSSGVRAPGSEKGRHDLALGSILAAYALGSTGFAIHHALCQTIVRETGTPHAETNAVILPHVVRMMELRAPAQMALLAAALGAERDPKQAADRVAALASFSGVRGLSELGVDRNTFPGIVAVVMNRPERQNLPSPPDDRELQQLLESAF